MSQILCDLVLLVWNHLEETRPCVDTLLRTVDVPSRLLLVDNGSDAPTREFLDGVRPAGHVREVRVLRNATNEGYARGMNRGLLESTAPYVCLLNNDLLFASNWLSELIAVAASSPRIGLVNPSSTTLGQHPAPGQSVEAYAATLSSQRGQWVEMGTIEGFCALIKRSVIEQIGRLDPSFGMAFFEDTDYAKRVQAAGFMCVRAKGAYVHHLEHRSVEDLWPSAEQRREVFEENAQRFYARWGRPERQAYVMLPNGGSTWLRDETRQHANRNSNVWVFHPARWTTPLPEHMKIIPHPLPERGFRLRALWQIVKKKKRFDRIVVNDRGLAWMLKRLHWLHRAQIDVR